jgi:photosystem II stability/assembly factor-like uncharacterized protein
LHFGATLSPMKGFATRPMTTLLIAGTLTIGACAGGGVQAATGTCSLPAHAAVPAGTSPPQELPTPLPGGCTVLLRERDNGRRLVVEPGTTIQVELPDDGVYGELAAAAQGDGRPLRTVVATGLTATFQAASPGMAAVEAADAHPVKSAPPAWRVQLEVRGLTLVSPIFTSATTGWARRGPSMVARGSILRTVDGGLGWTDITPRGLAAAPFTVMDAVGDTTAWVAQLLWSGDESYQRVYRTDDGGGSWTVSPVVGAGERLVDLTAVDGLHAWLLLTDDGDPFQPHGVHVMRTADGGRSWQEASAAQAGMAAGPGAPRNDCQPRQIAFADLYTGYLTGDACRPTYLQVTRDGGHTWSSQTPPPPPGVAATAWGAMSCQVTGPAWSSPVDGRLVIACPDDGRGSQWPGTELYVTHDAGATWLPAPLPGLAGGRPGTLTPTVSTAKPLPADILADFADPQHAWTWSEGRLLATANGGSTWTPIALDPETTRALRSLVFVSPTTGIAFDGAFGTFRRSADGGRSWSLLAPPAEIRAVPTPTPRRVAG